MFAPAFLHPFRARVSFLLAATVCALPFAGSDARAQTTSLALTTVYGFGGSDGANPAASLTQGNDGNLYGTTPAGGVNNAGTVYRITSAGAFTTLYSFSAPNDSGINADGSTPTAALVLFTDGSLYGTAQAGGTGGFGTVFKITTDGTFTTLYSFKSSDGNNPVAALVPNNDGFAGTTLNGGANADGTVYQITPAGGLTTIHSFTASDGNAPSSALVKGSDGSLYGTTRYGGANGVGTVFRIDAGGGFSTLYSFDSSAGTNPTAALVNSGNGYLYGVAPSGGANSRGTVFRLTTNGVETTLHSFSSSDNASYPSGLVQAIDGNLYGTTSGGGTGGKGAVFRITTDGTYTTLYNFAGTGDGSYPQAALIQGSDRNLYGTTSSGGSNARGTVFKLTPFSHPSFFSGEVPLPQGVYYLAFPANGNIFGYYEYLNDPHFVYHFDLGFEYVFDAADGHGGVYFYDFKSQDYFYTSPTFGFPYLYDFNLKAFLYYYPDPSNPQRYNTNGVRYFYNFSTGQVISR